MKKITRKEVYRVSSEYNASSFILEHYGDGSTAWTDMNGTILHEKFQDELNGELKKSINIKDKGNQPHHHLVGKWVKILRRDAQDWDKRIEVGKWLQISALHPNGGFWFFGESFWLTTNTVDVNHPLSYNPDDFVDSEWTSFDEAHPLPGERVIIAEEGFKAYDCEFSFDAKADYSKAKWCYWPFNRLGL